jgi:hypothetical protein
VSEDVVMSDDMKMVVWSEEHGDWTEEGITDYKYSESDRVVQFYINVVGLLALVKSRTADMPYKSWTLAPVYDKKINQIANGVVTRPVSAAVPAAASTDELTDGIAAVSLSQPVSARGPLTAPEDLPPPPLSHGTQYYEKQARFTIHTQKHDIVIDIIGDKCKLIQPTTKNFADIQNLLLSPGALLSKLQRKGVNLLPTVNDLACVEDRNIKV